MRESAECRRDSFVSESYLESLRSVSPTRTGGGGGVCGGISAGGGEEAGRHERKRIVEDNPAFDGDASYANFGDYHDENGDDVVVDHEEEEVDIDDDGVVYESAATRIYHLPDFEIDDGDGDDGGEENDVVSESKAEEEGESQSSSSPSRPRRRRLRRRLDAALKVLKFATPSPEQLSRLYNEHNVLSEHLYDCPSVRRSLRKDKVDGLHALYLEWAPGVTVRDWIRTRNGKRKRRVGRRRKSVPRRRRSSHGSAGGNNNGGFVGIVVDAKEKARLIEAARLALELAEALGEIHGRGVRHNRISADDILVEEMDGSSSGSSEADGVRGKDVAGKDDGDNGKRYNITFIDFALASLNESSATISAGAAGGRSSSVVGGGDAARRTSSLLPMRRGSLRSIRDSISSVNSCLSTLGTSSNTVGGRSGSLSVSHRGSAVSQRGSTLSQRGSTVSQRGSTVSVRSSSDHRGSTTAQAAIPSLLLNKNLSIVLDDEERLGGEDPPSTAAAASAAAFEVAIMEPDEDALGDLRALGAVFYQIFAGDAGLDGKSLRRGSNNSYSATFMLESQSSLFNDSRRLSGGDMSSSASSLPGSEDALNLGEGSRPTNEDGINGSEDYATTPLPRPLIAVVCDMMGINDPNASRKRYRSIGEVADDLRTMIREPERFMLDPPPPKPRIMADVARRLSMPFRRGSDGSMMQLRRGSEGSAIAVGTNSDAESVAASSTTMRLDLDPSRLYGREREEAQLARIFERARLLPRPELVLVSGNGGTGKSTLVKTVFRRLSAESADKTAVGEEKSPPLGGRFYFVSGKYDQVCQTEPYSAIIEAFTQLCDFILKEQDETFRNNLCDRIKKAVGSVSDPREVSSVIPWLSRILGDPGPGEGVKLSLSSKNMEHRFKFLLRQFVRTVATPEHPVVIFLDGCQWVDAASLQLLRVLLTDVESNSLVVVAAYRDNDVKPDQNALVQTCGDIEEQGVVVTRLVTESLTVEATAAILSDATRLTTRLTSNLARIIHLKTRGNIFFLLQFLRKLCDENVLYYSRDAMRWQWDEQLIASLDITENVVDMMADIIVNKISEAAQHVLKVAACLGSQFTVETLRVAVVPREGSFDDFDKNFDLAYTLEMAVAEGMIVGTGKADEFKFTHNRIQQAAYSLISPEERESFHLRVGELIAEDPVLLENMLFVAVGQLNMGMSLMTDPKSRTRLARLNLKAAKIAAASSAFPSAVKHLRAGLEVLDGAMWEEENHSWSVELHTLLADFCCCLGFYDEMEHHLNQVLDRARFLHQKVPAFIIQIKSLGAKFKLREACDTGFRILAQFGCTMPSKVTKRSVVLQFLSTKSKVRRMSNEKIFSLPVMTDETQLAVMRVIDSIFMSVFLSLPQYYPFLIFKLVQTSLRYGLCSLSSYAFACFAYMLALNGKNIKEAHRLAHISSLLLERFRANELWAKVHHTIRFGVSHWWEHVELSLEPLLKGYRVGLETGDVESACLCARAYLHASLDCGRPLGSLENEFRKLTRVMEEYQQKTVLPMIRIMWQMTLNLLGRSNDPVVLTGEIIDEDTCLHNEMAQQVRGRIEANLAYHKLKLAYLFGHHEMAGEAAEKCRHRIRTSRDTKSRFLACVNAYYDGLNAVALARKIGHSNWRPLAKDAMKTMKKWTRYAPQNSLHKVMLLEAEILAINGKTARARTLYDSSIAAAQKERFTQELGISCERTAIFLLDIGSKEDALEYYRRAVCAYREWGALAKVEHVEGQMLEHFGKL